MPEQGFPAKAVAIGVIALAAIGGAYLFTKPNAESATPIASEQHSNSQVEAVKAVEAAPTTVNNLMTDAKLSAAPVQTSPERAEYDNQIRTILGTPAEAEVVREWRQERGERREASFLTTK